MRGSARRQCPTALRETCSTIRADARAPDAVIGEFGAHWAQVRRVEWLYNTPRRVAVESSKASNVASGIIIADRKQYPIQRASTRVLKHRSQFIVTPKECRPHFLAACGLEEFSKQA